MNRLFKTFLKVFPVVALVFLLLPTHTFAVFKYSQSITVNTGQVPSTQSNFPMLFSGTYNFLKTEANDGYVTNVNGYDVGFYTTANCTTGKLNWETETYNAVTGAVNYWINISSLSDGTLIYVCYGDSSITVDQSNVSGVWDTNYKAVYHLPDGSSLSVKNSITGVNATNNGAAVATGQVDGGASFNGSSQYILSDNVPVTVAPVTYEAWVYPTATGVVMSSLNSANGWDGFYVYYSGTNIFLTQVYNNFAQSSSGVGTVTASAWNHVVSVGTNNSSRVVYVNGVAGTVDTVTVTTPLNTPDNFVMGAAKHGAIVDNYGGNTLDEVRVSNIARAANWITTEYNNQSAPSTFYTVGPQFDIPGPGAKHKILLAAIKNFKILFLGKFKFLFN